MMTIEQTVEIPASRKIHLDFEVPLSLPVGKAKVALTVTPDEPLADGEATPRRLSHREAIERCRGVAKGSLFSSERLFENRRQDRELEEEQYRQLFHKDGNNV
jgi:hypothetical protein